MSHSLALYNAHKRATLDRLTLTYQLSLRTVYREESSHVMRRMIDSLKVHHTNFNPDVAGSNLDQRLHKVFKDFQNHAIKAGVSDGIQEVSPEGRLNRWEDFPINMPIENTIISSGGTQLAGKRDKLGEDFKKANHQTLTDKLAEYVSGSRDAYMENIRKCYSKAAKQWFEGEQDTEEVRALLKKSLYSVDSDNERVLRTETTNYFNQTRLHYFKEETDVDWIELYAVTDGRISKICKDRHEFCVPIGKANDRKYMPAFHANCRTIQRPLFSYLKAHEAIIERSKNMNEASFAPLPPEWSRWKHA